MIGKDKIEMVEKDKIEMTAKQVRTQEAQVARVNRLHSWNDIIPQLSLVALVSCGTARGSSVIPERR
ncbi:hypothetical protein RRG08_003908 [Elysia crispata]|uniref:Uncharacterized protein n=1 Tax=Elysia crispata TaxID=231223 RepID=A0AAE0YTS0_9GAST|nr:hypothetical protein RRG08_003908 [Elysia crispata]